MNQLMVTKREIIEKVNALPPEALPELQAFIEFLRFKSETGTAKHTAQTRIDMWQAALKATFGMWADREDATEDGVIYVQNIRRGHRLNDFMGQPDETD